MNLSSLKYRNQRLIVLISLFVCSDLLSSQIEQYLCLYVGVCLLCAPRLDHRRHLRLVISGLLFSYWLFILGMLHVGCRKASSCRDSLPQFNVFTFYEILTSIVLSCPFTRKHGHKARCHHPFHPILKRPCLDRCRDTGTRNSCDISGPGFQSPQKAYCAWLRKEPLCLPYVHL